MDQKYVSVRDFLCYFWYFMRFIRSWKCTNGQFLIINNVIHRQFIDWCQFLVDNPLGLSHLCYRQGTSKNIFTCNIYLYTRRSILKIFLTPSAFLYRRWVSCYMCMWKRPQPYCQCAEVWVDRSRFKPGGSLCYVLGQNT